MAAKINAALLWIGRRTSTQLEYPEVLEVMGTLCRIQIESGGDPYLGRRLARLFKETGFSDVEVCPLDLRGDESDTVVLHGLTEVFANIFVSAEQALGPELAPKVQVAASRLRKLQSVKGGTIFYSPMVGRGMRRL